MKRLLPVWLFLLFGGLAVPALAAPRITLSPSSGSYTNGSSFTVTVGVNSETEKVLAMDLEMLFDATKLEVTSVVKASTTAFPFAFDPSDVSVLKINNTSGELFMTLAPESLSGTLAGNVANGSLVLVTFRTKATGTASLTYNCQSGEVNDTNIINEASTDVVDCSANQTGSYTITAATTTTTTTDDGDDDTTTTTSTTAPTATPTTRPAATGVLPQTGSIGSTVGLMVFGLFGLASAVFLRWL